MEYSLRYVHRVYPDGENRPASIGTAVHRGLAAHYLAEKQQLKSPELWRTAINAGPESEAVRLEAVRMVKHHNIFWDYHPPTWREVVDVEKPIAARVEDVPWTTRVDLLVRKSDGRKYLHVVDHKTSSRQGDSSTEFGGSAQFMGSIVAGRLAGLPLSNAVVINKLIKTTKPAFDRLEIAFTERQLQRWRLDLKALAGDLDRYMSGRRFPRRYEHCVGRYGPCTYWVLCHGPGRAAAGLYRIPKGVDLEEALR